MTDKQFLTLYRETGNYTDRDAYVSDMALSSVWGDDPGVEDIPHDRLDSIGSVWDAVRRTVRQIASDAGLSHRKLAERFCVPYRTMEDWCSGVSSCPDYTKLMMQELLGLIRR